MGKSRQCSTERALAPLTGDGNSDVELLLSGEYVGSVLAHFFTDGISMRCMLLRVIPVSMAACRKMGVAALVVFGFTMMTSCAADTLLSTAEHDASRQTQQTAAVSLSRPAQLPFALDVTTENRDVCVNRTASYGAITGAFKSWSAGTREQASVTYSRPDSTLARYRTLAFSRQTKRATQVVDCVLREGNDAVRYLARWANRNAAGAIADPDDLSALGWTGDQWCLYHFDGDYITCGTTTCWPNAASAKSKGRRTWGVANAYETNGSSYDCNNGCDIFFENSWFYDCGGSGGDLSGVGTSGDPPPTATLSCSPTNQFNATATCVLAITGYAAADDPVTWTFTAGDITVVDTLTSLTWSGPVVVGGTVKAEIVANGQSYSPTAALAVTRRSGWTWSSQIGGRQGTAGEIDACVDASGALGLTAGESCTSVYVGGLFSPVVVAQDSGYTSEQVAGSGPNGGLWFVDSSSTTMQIRTQVSRLFRSDGPTAPLAGDSAIVAACLSAYGNLSARSIYAVNTQCHSHAGLTNFLAFAWAHEGRHMQANLAAARLTANDLRHEMESLVATSEGGLTFKVKDKMDSIHESIVAAGGLTHTGTAHSFSFWRPLSGNWTWATTTILD